MIAIMYCYHFCYTVSCPTMEAPENGEVVVSSNGSVTIATFSCETDYSLYGNTVLSCISGTWEGTAPTCGKFLLIFLCHFNIMLMPKF